MNWGDWLSLALIVIGAACMILGQSTHTCKPDHNGECTVCDEPMPNYAFNEVISWLLIVLVLLGALLTLKQFINDYERAHRPMCHRCLK